MLQWLSNELTTMMWNPSFVFLMELIFLSRSSPASEDARINMNLSNYGTGRRLINSTDRRSHHKESQLLEQRLTVSPCFLLNMAMNGFETATTNTNEPAYSNESPINGKQNTEEPQRCSLFEFLIGMMIPWLIGHLPNEHANHIAVYINSCLLIICTLYVSCTACAQHNFHSFAFSLALAFGTWSWILIWFFLDSVR